MVGVDQLSRPLRELLDFRSRPAQPPMRGLRARKGSRPDLVLLPKSGTHVGEIVRVARIAVANRVSTSRPTGGEPFLRRGLEQLIAELAQSGTPGRTRGPRPDQNASDPKSQGT